MYGIKMISLILLFLAGASFATEWPRLDNPITSNLLRSEVLLAGGMAYQDSAEAADSLIIDPNDPDFRYLGRAALLSIVIPGAGQWYTGNLKRGLIFLSADVLGVFAWDYYRGKGDDQTVSYEAFADEWWDFHDWRKMEDNFKDGDWTVIPHMGTDSLGSHSLDFFYYNEQGNIAFMGDTKADAVLFDSLMTADIATSGSPDDYRLHPFKNHEYYENIGKYNQFFPGWADADGANPKIEDRKSGPYASSPKRDQYLDMREEANRLKSMAGFALSAMLFNHVISSTDALFATAKWNRENASRLSGRLLYNNRARLGVSGVQLTVAW